MIKDKIEDVIKSLDFIPKEYKADFADLLYECSNSHSGELKIDLNINCNCGYGKGNVPNGGGGNNNVNNGNNGGSSNGGGGNRGNSKATATTDTNRTDRIESEIERTLTKAQRFYARAGAVVGFAETVFSSVKTAVNRILGYWNVIDKKASESARSIGMTSRAREKFRTTAFDRYNKLEIGTNFNVPMEDLIDLKKNMSAAIGRNLRFSNDNLQDVAALTNLMGSEKVTQMIEKLDAFGLGIEEAGRLTTQMFNESSEKGLDFETYSKNFLENIEMAQTYNFQNGVKGVKSMAKKATELKFSMRAAAAFADKVGTLQGAIETGARLQALGGTFSTLSGPLSMFSESLLDTEALFDRMVGMFSKLGRFNKNTGEIEINSLDKRRAKEAASAIGVSYEDMMKGATNTARREEISKELALNNNGLNDNVKELLLNIATFENGVAGFTNSEGEFVKLQDVSNEDQKELITLSRSEADNVRSIAVSVRSMSEVMEGVKRQFRAEKGGAADSIFGSRLDTLNKSIKNIHGLLWVLARGAIALNILAMQMAIGRGAYNLRNVFRGVKGYAGTPGGYTRTTTTTSTTPGGSGSFTGGGGGNSGYLIPSTVNSSIMLGGGSVAASSVMNRISNTEELISEGAKNQRLIEQRLMQIDGGGGQKLLSQGVSELPDEGVRIDYLGHGRGNSIDENTIDMREVKRFNRKTGKRETVYRPVKSKASKASGKPISSMAKGALAMNSVYSAIDIGTTLANGKNVTDDNQYYGEVGRAFGNAAGSILGSLIPVVGPIVAPFIGMGAGEIGRVVGKLIVDEEKRAETKTQLGFDKFNLNGNYSVLELKKINNLLEDKVISKDEQRNMSQRLLNKLKESDDLNKFNEEAYEGQFQEFVAHENRGNTVNGLDFQFSRRYNTGQERGVEIIQPESSIKANEIKAPQATASLGTTNYKLDDLNVKGQINLMFDKNKYGVEVNDMFAKYLNDPINRQYLMKQIVQQQDINDNFGQTVA